MSSTVVLCRIETHDTRNQLAQEIKDFGRIRILLKITTKFLVQLCHSVGYAELNTSGKTRKLRHGDVIFGDANLNQVLSYFGAKGYGSTRIVERSDGLYIEVDPYQPESFRILWHGKRIVPKDYSATVESKDGKTRYPLYELLRIAVAVQNLIIDHKEELLALLHKEAQDKFEKLLAATA